MFKVFQFQKILTILKPQQLDLINWKYFPISCCDFVFFSHFGRTQILQFSPKIALIGLKRIQVWYCHVQKNMSYSFLSKNIGFAIGRFFDGVVSRKVGMVNISARMFKFKFKNRHYVKINLLLECFYQSSFLQFIVWGIRTATYKHLVYVLYCTTLKLKYSYLCNQLIISIINKYKLKIRK